MTFLKRKIEDSHYGSRVFNKLLTNGMYDNQLIYKKSGVFMANSRPIKISRNSRIVEIMDDVPVKKGRKSSKPRIAEIIDAPSQPVELDNDVPPVFLNKNAEKKSTFLGSFFCCFPFGRRQRSDAENIASMLDSNENGPGLTR
jgi:hypothetical protein